jgi:hypothetical protein
MEAFLPSLSSTTFVQPSEVNVTLRSDNSERRIESQVRFLGQAALAQPPNAP